jgi:predicted ATP-binding protein involved in virulence
MQKEIAVGSSGKDSKAALMQTLNRKLEERTNFEEVRKREKEELEQTISSLEEEVSCLKQRHKSFLDKRREALNKILDLKGNVIRSSPFCYG